MASSISLKKATTPSLPIATLLRLNRLRPAAFPFAGALSFHTNAPTGDSDGNTSPDHLRKTLETFDFKGHPFQIEGPQRPCDLKEDDEALYARVDMAGVGKGGVKVWLENNNSLCIAGEERERPNAELVDSYVDLLSTENERRKFSTRLAVNPDVFDTDGIKALMKNGVLRVVIPKLKHG